MRGPELVFRRQWERRLTGWTGWSSLRSVITCRKPVVASNLTGASDGEVCRAVRRIFLFSVSHDVAVLFALVRALPVWQEDVLYWIGGWYLAEKPIVFGTMFRKG
jgi:hypothetical protein